MFVNPLIKCTILFVPIFTVVIIGAIGCFFCGISMIETIAFISDGGCFLPPPTMFAMPEVHIQSSKLINTSLISPSFMSAKSLKLRPSSAKHLSVKISFNVPSFF